MAIYSYKCPKCNSDFDKLLKMNESDNEQVCPNCGFEKVTKHFETANVHFKGSGFYSTDYPKMK